MPSTLTLRAYAKINLHLRIGRRDPATGYHALETLFQTVSLYDTLRVSRAKTLQLTGDLEKVPAGPENLILRAADALRARVGREVGARIHLAKHIPVAAGLGGGSTDAAATLFGLDILWCTEFTEQKLRNIAKTLGADVPFLLSGGAAIATGVGDRLRPCRVPLKPWWIVLITSQHGVSTAEAYANLAEEDKAPGLQLHHAPSGQLRALARAWTQGDWPQTTENSFERSIFASRPRLGILVEALRAHGAVTAHLSGSGPTVFGLFESARSARAARDGLTLQEGEAVLVARPEAQSPRVMRLSP